MNIRPEIVSICDSKTSESVTGWFTSSIPTIKQVTGNYREVLENPDVDAVYIAVPITFMRRCTSRR